MKTVPLKDQPVSEQFRVVAKKWVDADRAARLMEELKTSTLAEMKNKLIVDDPKMANNKAEDTAKASQEWREYITEMVNHRSDANLLKVQLEFLRMQFHEWQSANATNRAEMRMTR